MLPYAALHLGCLVSCLVVSGLQWVESKTQKVAESIPSYMAGQKSFYGGQKAAVLISL